MLFIHNIPNGNSVYTDAKYMRYFDPRDTTITRSLNPKLTIQEIVQIADNGGNTIASSGIQLLLLILCCKPKQVYLSGIDTDIFVSYFDNRKYKNDGSGGKINNHYNIDKFILSEISLTFKNVYTIDKTSPLSKIFPVKKL